MIKSFVLFGMMSLSTVMYGSNDHHNEVMNNIDRNGQKIEMQMDNQKHDRSNDRGHKMTCKCQEQIQKHCHNKHCTCSCHKQVKVNHHNNNRR